jgi:hypothetical protein
MEQTIKVKNNKWIIGSDYVKKYHTDYYKKAEVIQCDCYGNYKTVNKHKHFASRQHRQYLARVTPSVTQQESVAVKG